jgi:hypothetical protein
MNVNKNPSRNHTHCRLLHSLANRAQATKKRVGYGKPNKFAVQDGVV